MAPKNSLNLATSDGEEERHHQLRRCRVKSSHEHRLDGCVTMKKKKKKMVTDKVKKKKKTKKLKLELEEEEAKKSLYICFLEYHEGKRVSYVVRTIKLSDLFSSSNSELRQVAYEAGDHLPGSVGCGVMGSRIIFAGGLKPSVRIASIGPESVWHTDVYAFETDPNKQQPPDNTRIRKMDATLLQGKCFPLTVEIAGKLYALSYRRVSDPPSFEVFDPKIGKWSALPQPPFLQLGSRYWFDAPLAYAIAGTKIFASHQKCPVFCFDVAHPNREWRLVPTMCRGGPFPFYNKSLVLDLPEDGKKKIMFAYNHEYPRCLRVYLMSMDENQESITPITGGFKLPMWPYEFGLAATCDIVHIGGQKACFLITQFDVPHEHRPKYKPGTHKTRGVAIPFQFQVDITKVDKDKKNCFTLQFMPLCIFEYHTNPSSLPTPGSPQLLAAVKFIAHLVNQQVAHEIIALELLTVLLENPSDDSVEVAVGFVTECGSILQDLSPKGLHGIFERFRGILHEGEIDKRVQFLIEGLFALRKAKFQGHPAVRPELDLVEQEDQLTHEISLQEEINQEITLDIFKPDPDFIENEKRYEEVKKTILGEDSEDEGSDAVSDGEDDDDDDEGDDEEEDEQQMKIRDETETNLVNLRRTIYLTIMSSVDFEEAGHKLLKIKLEPGQEMELCVMLLECCSQERTYLRYYGLLGQRFCMINRIHQENFEKCFVQQYSMIHRLETNKLRNVAKFFAHLLGTDALPWHCLAYIRLTEEDTTSSSRIFIKILFQELSEHLGIHLLNERLTDPAMQDSYESIFPRDNPKNTRFAINFFTSIGLGGITENLREYLKHMPRLIMQQQKAVSDEESESSGSSDSESGSSESESESESSSSESESDRDERRKKKRRRRN